MGAVDLEGSMNERKRGLWLWSTCAGVAVFGGVGLACGGGAKGPDEAPTPTATAVVADPTPTSTAETPVALPAPEVPKDIVGDYDVTGTNVNGAGSYKGTLGITKQGESYRFTWVSGSNSYFGVGLQSDATVAVSFTEEKDGKGCGVQLYKIGSNGSLNGKSAYWGLETNETELGVRVSGSDLAGLYDVIGATPDGGKYTAKLTIAASGPGFTFEWAHPKATVLGRGVKKGDMVIAGLGRKQCSFVAYDVLPDGSLEGVWGGVGTSTLGTEKAIRKK